MLLNELLISWDTTHSQSNIDRYIVEQSTIALYLLRQKGLVVINCDKV